MLSGSSGKVGFKKELGRAKTRENSPAWSTSIKAYLFSYFRRNKDYSDSVKSQSLGFLNVLAQPSIFRGELGAKVRFARFSYILDQVVNRMHVQQYRIVHFQHAMIADFRKRWPIRNFGSDIFSHFSRLVEKRFGLNSILFNLKFQRFCRLFTILYTAKYLADHSNDLGLRSQDLISDSRVPNPVRNFFDQLWFEDCFFVYEKCIHSVNVLFVEFTYYEQFVNVFEHGGVEIDYCGDIGISRPTSCFPNIFWDKEGVLTLAELYEGFHFSSWDTFVDEETYNSLLYISDVQSATIFSKLDRDKKISFGHKLESLMFFHLDEILKLYLHVRNYKSVNNLSNFVIPLDFIKLSFSPSFLEFLHMHNYIYVLKGSHGILHLLLSELFLVFLHKLFFSLLAKLLELGTSTQMNLKVCELLEFVNQLCLDSRKNVLYNTSLLISLIDAVKTNLISSDRYAGKVEVSYRDFSNILTNYVQDLVFNFDQNSIVYQRNKTFFNRKLWKLNYKLSIIGRRSSVASNKEPNRRFPKIIEAAKNGDVAFISGKNKILISTFYNYRKQQVLRSKMQSHTVLTGNRLSRRGLKQHLRRHKKRFIYQHYFQYMLDRKLEVARNRQLRSILTYLKVWGRGLFTRFRVSDEFSDIKIISSVPSKKRLKKKRKIAYVYPAAELHRNPYDSQSKRLLYNARTKRTKLTRRHIFLKAKFPVGFKKRIFIDFFISPRFLNFRAGARHLYFSQLNLDLTLKNKTGLFFRLCRFLEFLVKLALKVKLGLKRDTLLLIKKPLVEDSMFVDGTAFSYLFTLYRRVKLVVLNFMGKLGDFFTRNIYKVSRTRVLLNFSSLRVRFGFFYNYLSLKFFKFFVLRYFFFSDYVRSRLQFITRYLWFRVIPLNANILNPKIFIIITKLRNNFFITGIDLFGRILYKTSPGMVGFTGTDRMSKYAWFEASVDFFDGFIEFIRYFLKGRKRKRGSFVRWRLVRTYGDRLHGMKRVLGAFFDTRKLDLWKLSKKMKKKKAKQKLKMRRFFVISKGISDFNLRIFRKGMLEQRYLISRFFVGAINYPNKSFSLCRIRKVRRV